MCGGVGVGVGGVSECVLVGVCMGVGGGVCVCGGAT